MQRFVSFGIKTSLLFFVWCTATVLHAAPQQNDSLLFFENATGLNKKRLYSTIAVEAASYTTVMIGLNNLWYKDYPRSNFHFFNDNSQWLQMDKAGHVMTSYYIGKAGIDVLKWSGASQNKANLYGGTLGLFFLTSVEMFDGFSSQWGFSAGDAAANFGGTALLLGQQYLWNEQRVQLKFSVQLTQYAQYRPQVLGSTKPERLLKDYNGQTYWMSITPGMFMKKESNFPKWLSISLGYGGSEMIKGDAASYSFVDNRQNIQTFNRYRQYYLSLDINLANIKTRSKFLHALLSTFNFIKIPFPALELSRGEVKVHPLYF